MLGRLERRLRRERRSLRNALATGSVSDALAATGNVSDVVDAIGGIAMPAAFGGTATRLARPATRQRTPHVHALVDSGCNQHLLKDLSLFVTLDRKRAMLPFTVASDRTTIPQGYGTSRFGVTDEQGDQLTVTLPGCYLDDTLPFNLLSVSQLLHAGTISNPEFTRRELHFHDGPGFVGASPSTRTVRNSALGSERRTY